MGSHKISPISPPYPDPRKWKTILNEQGRGLSLNWMTPPSSTERIRFPSDFIVLPHTDFSYGARDAEYTAPLSTEPNIETAITACDYDGPHSTADRSLLSEQHEEERLSGLDDFDRHESECSSGDHQNGELGEEVEVLELNDFWLNRLSHTVKRMKSKNRKKH